MKPDEPFADRQIDFVAQRFGIIAVLIALSLSGDRAEQGYAAAQIGLKAWGSSAERPDSRRTLAKALVRLFKDALPKLEAFVDETGSERN